MTKVNFFDKRILVSFLERTSIIGTILSLLLIFVDIPKEIKPCLGVFFIFILVIIYFFLWLRANSMQHIDINIEGSIVTIKVGNIFDQSGFKVISFNEFFDTKVDDKIISKKSLNGFFINKFFPSSTVEIDKHIENYSFDEKEIIDKQVTRNVGKTIKYEIGSICVFNDYLLTAFSKFDAQNRATLTMPEYLSFLINFWDKVNKVYSQESVSVPIFGSGITRIKEHKNICDEDLLKIMLWTFRISEMRFKYPAKLTIVIHKDKINNISLFDIKSAKNGI